MGGIELVIAILGCSAISALINQVGTYIIKDKEYKEKKETRKDEKQTEFDQKIAEVKKNCEDNVDTLDKSMKEEVAAVKGALKLIMLDRIRFIGQDYIREGEIDFDDRRILKQMHSMYHNNLGGNGDLDTLMAEIDKLPLKVH